MSEIRKGLKPIMVFDSEYYNIGDVVKVIIRNKTANNHPAMINNGINYIMADNFIKDKFHTIIRHVENNIIVVIVVTKEGIRDDYIPIDDITSGNIELIKLDEEDDNEGVINALAPMEPQINLQPLTSITGITAMT